MFRQTLSPDYKSNSPRAQMRVKRHLPAVMPIRAGEVFELSEGKRWPPALTLLLAFVCSSVFWVPAAVFALAFVGRGHQ